MKYNEEQIFMLLFNVFDPELKIVNIVDLGIVQAVKIIDNNVVVELISRVQDNSAMEKITSEIKKIFKLNNMKNYKIEIKTEPVWTSSFISYEGRNLLRRMGRNNLFNSQ